ncbi:MAG: hypothetical protein N2B06_16900 [Clostridium sp.]
MNKLCILCNDHLNLLSDCQLDVELVIKIKKDIEKISGPLPIDWDKLNSLMGEVSISSKIVEKNLEKFKCIKLFYKEFSKDIIFVALASFLKNKELSEIQYTLLKNYHKVIKKNIEI